MTITAISPKQAREQYDPKREFPECILEAINSLISKKVNSSPENANTFTLRQKEVFSTIDNAIENYNKNKPENAPELVFQSHYRDIENIYRKAGWIVNVDWPGYNESYEGSWKFSYPHFAN